MDVGPLVAVGQVAGAVIAITAAIAAVGRLPAGRWLWRRLVTGPINEWALELLRPVRDRLEDGDLRFQRIEARQMGLAEALKPTNGDDRTLSDRVDDCLKSADQCVARIDAHAAVDNANFGAIADHLGIELPETE